jgi:hypothetical protein
MAHFIKKLIVGILIIVTGVFLSKYGPAGTSSFGVIIIWVGAFLLLIAAFEEL